jgi:hypothetical protein
MSRNVFQKSSDDSDNEQPQGIAIGLERGNGPLPYIALLAKILEKISPSQPNKKDETESIKVALASLGIVLKSSPKHYEKLVAFIGIHASACMPDGEMSLSDAPEGFVELREKFKDEMLEAAKEEAESNLDKQD